MNRLLKFLILAVLVAALGATALAQDALPLPENAAESTPKSTIGIFGPLNGEISAMSPMIWESLGVPSYKIHFKIVSTGQKITWQPQFMCTPQCMNYEYPMPLFDAAKDGDEVWWWVSAKSGGVTVKSEKTLAWVNEIDAAEPVGPINGMTLPRENVIFLMWSMVDIAVKQKVVLKNDMTGEVVLKSTIDMNTQCSVESDICAFVFGGANPTIESVFNHGTAYKWFVVTTGVSGEKAKSDVARFSTLAAAN